MPEVEDVETIRTPTFLLPGELVMAETPVLVKTVLGSCLAITMHASRFGLAAVAHCQLPSFGAPADGLTHRERLKYVDTTIDLMLRAFERRGVVLGELRIKLFGGADTMAARQGGYRVGNRNVETALRVLAARGLVPTCTVVGGRRGRLIEFDSTTGEVLVKQLAGSSGDPGGEER